MTIDQKILFLQNRIDNMSIHVSVLSQDIEDNPDSEIEGKRERGLVLNDLLSEISVLQAELEALTNQG